MMIIIEQLLSEPKTIEERICNVLAITKDEYSWYIYENGLAYLDNYLKGNEHLKKYYERSKLFWAWFRNMFYEMDAVVVSSFHFGELKSARAIYDAVHNASDVAKERTPPRCVQKEIQNMIKNENNK